MKFAYADPPYLGRGEYYRSHHPDAMSWNRLETHAALIERLQAIITGSTNPAGMS